MANTFFGLNIGTLGIQAANTNLHVTANNIANEHTKGYSRQEATQQATVPLRVYQKYGMIGSGVEVTSIERIRNEYYDVKYQENQTRYGENNAKQYYMLKIEDTFNEAKVDGFTQEFENLYVEAMEELQKDGSDMTTRSLYLNYSESFIEYVQEIKTDLKLAQEDLNSEVSTYVSKINSLAQEIASINKQINVVELTGANANELRDRRTVLLDELSEIVEINTFEKTYENGKTEFTVQVGTSTLVDNYDYYTLKVETREEGLHNEDITGLYDITWSHGQKFDPVAQGIGGALKGLLEVRDGNNGVQANPDTYPIDYKGIPYYIRRINEFLDEFTTSINEIHQKGIDLYGNQQTEPLYVKSGNGVYSVNEKIKNDPNLLATTYNLPDGVSNTDLVDDLIKTKGANIYNGGTAQEYLQSIITEIAIDTKKSKTFTENYQNMQVTIENQRLSIMGVDKDEEAMNLVKFQEAFDLNSKVISVLAEIYDKLIQETGV